MSSRIRSVDVFPVTCTLPRPVGDGQGLQPVRRSTFVRVMADDGSYGWGEGGAPIPGAALLRDRTGPELVGLDALDTDLVRDRALRHGLGRGLVGALDAALWDLKGKLLDVPVVRLLGGARRDRVPAYASLHNYSPSADCADELRALIEDARGRGFRAVKMKIGGRSLSEDTRYLRVARQAAGAELDLMADANECYELPQAVRMGRVLEELDFVWFEEPLRRSDVRGYAELRARLDIPIAGGEGSHSAADLQPLLHQRAIDIAQPDVANVGGISEARHLPRLAALWGVMPTFHVWNSPLVQVATLHLLANQEPWRPLSTDPRAAPLEVTTMPNPMREALLVGAPTVGRDGALPLPDGPGLGGDVALDALRAYALEV
jgi:D-galactarolactone cycloisomerase